MNRRATMAVAAALICVAGSTGRAAWDAGARFHVGTVNGKPCLIDPAGQPFKSVGMVWAYGPERGPKAGPLTKERLVEQLALIQSLGFNTLNLYGDQLIPEMLAWCDEHELAVYFRTAFNDLPGLTQEQKEFPDLMDAAFREKAKAHFAKFLSQVKGHPSVLAIDTDNRWLFPIDWSGAVRAGEPKLGPESVKHLPRWLEKQYSDVAALNAAWGTSCAAFDDVLRDRRIVQGGRVVPPGDNPWRVDLYRYTLWTQADFLRELAGHLKAGSGGLLVTPTTEHPECVPDVNPDPSTGVDFMSPVHYNYKDDFDRDLPSLCKLIYETRWHRDMQGGPTYVSETGWRTGPLEQNPPNRDYAWMVPQDEEVAARSYAAEFSLLQVLPWISGYGYFMLYDKWPEGDFGYLRDDMTKKPQALVGDAVNGAFNVPALADPAPQVWIYYPEYALATHRPGFQQVKTFVMLWEQSFITSLYARIDQHWKGLRAGDRAAGAAFAADVTSDFTNLWRGFAFTKTLPSDDKPVLLLPNIAEILSAQDRIALLGKKTLCFGPVGLFDPAMRATPRWNDIALNLKEGSGVPPPLGNYGAAGEGRVGIDVKTGARTVGKSFWSWLPWWTEPAFSWEASWSGPVKCDGQAIQLPPGCYKQLELVAGSTGGDAAGFCEIAYGDGTKQRALLGPAISDTRFAPAMTPGIDIGSAHYSLLAIPLEPQRAVRSLQLPRDARIELRGAALVSGGVASNAVVSFEGRGSRVEGKTAWLWSLKPGKHVVVLEQFANGDPAVVAFGRNVTYLYDPLTWAGKPDEISRQVEAIGATVDHALKHLETK